MENHPDQSHSPSDDPRLRRAADSGNSWLSMSEIEALHADPWDFIRNDDREEAARTLLDVRYDEHGCDFELMAETADVAVPIYDSDLLEWASRRQVRTYIDEVIQRHDVDSLSRVLMEAAYGYWHEVFLEAHRALDLRRLSLSD
jgi:hypothetical protein